MIFALQISNATLIWVHALGTLSIIQWIRISDFGLLDPDGDTTGPSTPLQNLSTWSLGHAPPHPPTPQEISSKSVHNFFSYPTDRQTHRQTDRSKNITSFFGRGNNIFYRINEYQTGVQYWHAVRHQQRFTEHHSRSEKAFCFAVISPLFARGAYSRSFWEFFSVDNINTLLQKHAIIYLYLL